MSQIKCIRFHPAKPAIYVDYATPGKPVPVHRRRRIPVRDLTSAKLASTAGGAEVSVEKVARSLLLRHADVLMPLGQAKVEAIVRRIQEIRAPPPGSPAPSMAGKAEGGKVNVKDLLAAARAGREAGLAATAVVEPGDLDLNKIDETELRKIKGAMEVQFEQIRIKPTDPRFVYDKRVDFGASDSGKEDNDWDSDGDEDAQSVASSRAASPAVLATAAHQASAPAATAPAPPTLAPSSPILDALAVIQPRDEPVLSLDTAPAPPAPTAAVPLPAPSSLPSLPPLSALSPLTAPSPFKSTPPSTLNPYSGLVDDADADDGGSTSNVSEIIDEDDVSFHLSEAVSDAPASDALPLPASPPPAAAVSPTAQVLAAPSAAAAVEPAPVIVTSDPPRVAEPAAAAAPQPIQTLDAELSYSEDFDFGAGETESNVSTGALDASHRSRATTNADDDDDDEFGAGATASEDGDEEEEESAEESSSSLPPPPRPLMSAFGLAPAPPSPAPAPAMSLPFKSMHDADDDDDDGEIEEDIEVEAYESDAAGGDDDDF
ncbi:hypothetical protein H9P43_004829 [Blastocladiella emersonii ATCC 22665]|nr:hypothetical protein H9P43_004829 [Blastocladiella emersonii ATCC 22665]